MSLPQSSSLPRPARQGDAWLARSALAVVGMCLLSHCSSSSRSSGPAQVVVSVPEQKMGFYRGGELVKSYAISTSKFGLGDRPGSNCTPLGKCEVIAKIGHGLPAGAVLKSRHWNGEVLRPNAPGRDPIVSRILWLRGLEGTNRNAFNRFIYIHGTPEEKRIGTPASYGCIRMKSRDVIDLFNTVPIGAKVVITQKKLPHGNDDGTGIKVAELRNAVALPASDPTPAQQPATEKAKPAVASNSRKGTKHPL